LLLLLVEELGASGDALLLNSEKEKSGKEKSTREESYRNLKGRMREAEWGAQVPKR
jgi:hypothetical protein|tara:strand:+ start:91 stop:258 length:168 start_codon:yes stop_codon:yes gene_type:complete